MYMKRKGIFSLVISMGLLAGCATTAPVPDGPKPPQNLLGSTDELQLITELSIDLAKTYGGDQVLVVLGLENTLLDTQGNSDASCISSAQQTRTTRPAQQDTAMQVQRMQDAGLKVIALTSRGNDCLDQTVGELNSNGFDFQASAWPPVSGFSEGFGFAGGENALSYEQGIFFTSSQGEGPALKALVEKSGEPYPTLIVVADQRQKYLNSVMKSFSTSAIKVHTWRYTREGTQVASSGQ
jgi:hypothetical protein